jgi:3-hydroxybutyryl-CoA dehydratase
MTQQTQTGNSRRTGDEPAPIVRVITQERINRYARASGDLNPIHIDPGFAAGTQFGGTIAHGMLVLAQLSEMMTAACGNAWPAGGRLKARFRAPARPGDTVTACGRVKARDGGRTLYEVECRNQAGDLLITGEAEVSE